LPNEVSICDILHRLGNIINGREPSALDFWPNVLFGHNGVGLAE
jgi:hypothetical protein